MITKGRLESELSQEEQDLMNEALKNNTVEEFVGSRQYQGGEEVSQEIEVFDEYDNKYQSMQELEDKIISLERSLQERYNPDLYDTQAGFEKDIEEDIKKLKDIEEEAHKKIQTAEFDNIENWLDKNKFWLGKKKNYISDLIYDNKNTRGSAWKALIENNDEVEAIEIIRRMEIAKVRHNTTDYDEIIKKGMTDEQVKKLRRDAIVGTKVRVKNLTGEDEFLI